MMKRSSLRVLALVALVAALFPISSAGAQSLSFSRGDVFVGVGSSTVQWRASDGSLKRAIATSAPSPNTTGMAQDDAGRLYVTGYTSNVVSRIATSGVADGLFGPDYSAHPESIVFDAAGNAYVGLARGERDVLKLSPAGALLARYDVPTDGSNGAERLDLGADQCTLAYTSGASTVRRYDVCTDSARPSLGTVSGVAHDVRYLPDGGVLVAATGSVVRLSSSGAPVATYDVPDSDCWLGVALDVVKDRFWAADSCASHVVQFDLRTGAVLGSFSTGTKSGSVGGIAVAGGLTAARGSRADLSVEQADAPDAVTADNDVRYVLTVANAGPNGTAGVTVDDSVSTGEIRYARGDGWTCSIAGASATCSLGGGSTVLEPGETAAPLDIVVRVPESSEPLTIENVATVVGDEPDYTPSNDTSVEQTAVDGGGNGTATGYIPPEGGQVTTQTGSCPDDTDHTCGTAIFPPGPGGIASLVELPGGLTFCAVLGDSCRGDAVDVIVPPGYTDPANPIVFQLIYDVSVVDGESVAFYEKSDLGPVPVAAPALPCPDSGPTPLVPCLAGTTELENGDVVVEFHFLSGDPKFQLL